MLDIRRAVDIGGWMREAELLWLAERAQHSLTIAEIGCWMGRTTCALADNTPGKVIAVDTWRGSEEHQAALRDKGPDYLYDSFRRNLDEHIHTGKVVPVRMPSVEAAAQVKHITFDLIFIDAAHDYENVKADIRAWRSLLSPDGFFCGHDYDAGRTGVVRAVDELIAHVGRGAGSIWYQEGAH